MKLSLEQIKNITFGALSVEEDGGAFVFKRITDEQKEIYAESNHLLKVGATSSVMLDFYTDSETLSFHYVVSAASSRSFYAFDIYVGGVMVSHVGEEEAKHFRGNVDVALGSGEKRVRVYFPCLFSADISDVTLSDGSYIRRTPKKRKALMLGDSITQGYDAKYPSLCYANLISEELSLDAVNQGIGGEIFRPENLGSVPVTDPEIITVAYGTNDWAATSYKRITNKVPRYFERLRDLYPSAKIIYISPIWRGDTHIETPSGGFDAHCDRVSDMAKAAGAYVIDGRKLIPHDSGVFADVVLHPNDLGFTRYADALVKEIRKLGILD